MTRQDPTDPAGLAFVLSVEAEPIGDDKEVPCVWCNHPDAIAERKHFIAGSGDSPWDDPDEMPDDEAYCLADYQFVFGDAEGAHSVVPVCEGCLYDLPVEYGYSDARDLPFRWQQEVVLKTEVPRLDADHGSVHRGVPVAVLADLSTDFSTDE